MQAEYTDADVDIVLQQAPEGVDIASVRDVLCKTKGNVTDAIATLWNVPPPSQVVKTNDKMANVREICDAYDTEMEKVFKSSK